jgi:hypothetical protein
MNLTRSFWSLFIQDVDALGTPIEGADMSITATRKTSKRRSSSTELDDELGHIRDLVFLRDLFTDRGATPDEIVEFDAAIAQARERLAASVRQAEPDLAA